MTYFQFPLSLVYTIKNLHDIYHGINRDLRFKGGHRPRRKVNFVQFFAKEEILNVISILYPKEILIINGKKMLCFMTWVYHYMEKLIYPVGYFTTW